MRVIAFIFLLILAPVHAHALDVQKVKSADGILAWLVEDHSLPLISLKFSFKGGVETDPAAKQGLAYLATSLLTKGAGPYDEVAFQEKLAANSIHMDFTAARDYVYGEVKTLRRTKGKAFRLLRLALTQPRFDAASFDRMKARQKVASNHQLSSPSWQGRYALYQAVYGDHPYAYRSLGSQTTIDAIAREDVVAFAQKHFAKDNLQVTVVGAINQKELAQLLDQVFGSLPVRNNVAAVPAVVWSEETQKIKVERKGKQTNVLFLSPMIKREEKDWYAARIANYILGGGSFMSRLMKQVRAEKGLTYGISTGLAPMDKASVLVGGFSTDNEKAGRAMGLVKQEWQQLYEVGLSEEELKAAQDYLVGSIALSLTSTDAVADVLLSMRNEGLPIDYLDQRSGHFHAVTKADVNRVIKKWFNPNVLSSVFVGKPKGIKASKTVALVKK